MFDCDMAAARAKSSFASRERGIVFQERISAAFNITIELFIDLRAFPHPARIPPVIEDCAAAALTVISL